MKKRSLIAAIFVILCFVFTGCSGNDDASSNPPRYEEQTERTTNAQTLQQVMMERGHFIWDVEYDELANRTSHAYIYSAGLTELQIRSYLSGYNNITDQVITASQAAIDNEEETTESDSNSDHTATTSSLRPVNNLTDHLENAIKNTIDWAKQDQFYAFNENALTAVGQTECDWLALGIARFGYPDDTESYLQSLENYVTKKYVNNGFLSDIAATEYQRPILSLAALGGNPKSFGSDSNGAAVNLLADGIYSSIMTPMWKQGINAAAYGLIALDCKQYEVPTEAATTRESILEYLISKQLADGGFALSGNSSDPDITAIVLQALVPYYDSETVYSNGKTVKTIVDEAFALLSEIQLDNGGYGNGSVANAESTAQVLIALCAFHIDPLTDQRFISRNGKTVLDGLMNFYNSSDGGFIHASSTAGQSNNIATDQARYALVAYYRYVNGLRPLYDYREESNVSAQKIEAIITEIEQLPETATMEDLETIYNTAQKYNLLNSSDKSQITNRGKLQILLNELEELSNQTTPNNPQPGNTQTDAAKKLDEDIAALINPINIRLSDADTVNALYQRYLELSETEQNSLEHSSDLLLARKIIEGLQNNTVIKEVFELIAGKDLEYTITGVCDNKYAYTITFKGTDISKPMNFDARILTAPSNGEIIRNYVSDAYYINFPHQGEFPGKATVTLSVDLTGSNYSMYYYNASQNDFEQMPVSLKNMRATFEANRGGDYILTQKKVSKHMRQYSSADFSNGIVPKSVFEEIQGQNVNLILDGTTENGEAYTITFNGMDITNPMDFNMQIYFGKKDCENEDNIRKLSENPFMIHFMHEGEIPGAALIEIPQTSLTDGNYLLFFYLVEEMKADYIDKVTVESVATKFIITHCSDYFITKRAKSGSLLDEDQSSQSNGSNVSEHLSSFWSEHRWIVIGSIIVLIIAAGIITAAVIHHKRLKKEDLLNDNISS